MNLALLSDTHGHVARTRAAAERLAAANPDVVVHAGDVGKEAVLIELAAVFDPLGIPVHAVLGNVDLYNDEVVNFPSTTCVSVAPTAAFELAGTRIGVIHGHERELLKQWIHSGRYDLIITGHTHRRSDKKIGDTRVVNPGAVYRADVPGCAMLDLKSGDLRYFDLIEK